MAFPQRESKVVHCEGVSHDGFLQRRAKSCTVRVYRTMAFPQWESKVVHCDGVSHDGFSSTGEQSRAQ